MVENFEVKITDLGGWSCTRTGQVDAWFKGYVLGQNPKDHVVAKCISLINTNQIAELDHYLENLNGHYALVIHCSAFLYACVDSVRSIPLFFFTDQKKIVIGDHAPSVLPKALQAPEYADPKSMLQIAMSGYTLDYRGLYPHLRYLAPGQRLIFFDDGTEDFRQTQAYQPWQVTRCMTDPASHLAKITGDIFRDVVRELRGRQVVVPLSAGNDSRLVVAMLKEFGHENVLCFSYGIPGNFEARIARKIARRLGYEWIFVPLSLRGERKFYCSAGYRAYLAAADNLDAVPNVQGLTAIRELKRRGLVQPDSVWINGNSGDFISGGHVPFADNPQQALAEWEMVKRYYLTKHSSLWSSLRTSKNDAEVIRCIDEIHQSLEDDYQSTPSATYEYLEFLHRQSKYVIAGQRTFEFYGFEWRMPLWDQRYLRFWSQVPVELKLEQNLYKSMLHDFNFFGLWSEEFPINRKDIRPLTVSLARKCSKMPFGLFGRRGKDCWKRFDRCVYFYFYDVTRMMCTVPYLKVLRSCSKGPRHHVSFQVQEYLAEKGLSPFERT